MKFTLRHMEVFRAVMLTGSVSAAARMLFVSQPVVSRTLSHMEGTLGLQLFDRNGNSIRPTATARTVLQEIDEMYAHALRINDLVENLKVTPRRRLSFCVSPTLGLTVVPAAIRSFSARLDGIRLSYRTALLKDMPDQLLSKAVDFGLSVWPIDHPNLHCERLFEGRIVLVVPEQHPLARFDTVRLAQLEHVPTIMYAPSMPAGASIREAFLNAGVTVDAIVEIDRSELACALVRQGVGVALVDQFSARSDIWRGVTTRELDIHIPASVCLVTSRFEKLSSDALDFVRSIEEECARNAP